MNKRKTVIITVMLVVMSIMAIGYSYFATRLNINATGSIDSSWNVYFSKIEVGTKSSGASTKSTPSVSNTTANMDVSLKSPGDYINFNITLVNGGSVDAIIEDIEATAEGTDAIIFNISGIKIGDKLAGGSNTSKVITIKMEYDSSITSQPSETTKRLTVNIDAVQDIGQNITPTDPVISSKLSSKILSNNVAYADNVASPYVTREQGIDFSQPSSDTNGKGLYYTSTNTEGNNTTYYFRGDVDNNYVSMGTINVDTGDMGEVEYCSYWYDYVGVSGSLVSKWGFETLEECEASLALEEGPDEGMEPSYVCGEDCWSTLEPIYEEQPRIWRIVRINEDGSIRLISTREVSESGVLDYFNYDELDYSEQHFVGYMYGTKNTSGDNAYKLTHTNTNDSRSKVSIDDWYPNLVGYTSVLADAGFCNDRSVAPSAGLWHSNDTALGYGYNATYYGSYNRLINQKQPQFKCQNASNDLFTLKGSSKGNQALSKAIGMITADELVYAGAAPGKDSDFYLNGYSFWTMTPYHVDYGGTNDPMMSTFEMWRLDNGTLSSGCNVTSRLHAVINLKADVYASGSGTETDPYVIQID